MVWRIVRATMVNIRGKVYRRLGSDETACTPVGAPQPGPKSAPSRHRINLLGSLESSEVFGSWCGAKAPPIGNREI
jgi:hypothetical protein